MTTTGPIAGLAFGTSGLRAPAVAFDAGAVAAYVSAFLTHVGAPDGGDVYVGCDLRASSPEISSHVIAAIAANGQVPRWCGVLPTPAVAAAALARDVPAIIVTGSHIPEDFNGIKFYRPDGELLKSDEAPIRALAEAALEKGPRPALVPLPAVDDSAARAYVTRYTSAFGSDALAGLKLGLFEHSAAGRDLTHEILAGLGATVWRFGRSDRFVAVDTEALDPESVALCAGEIAGHGLDAVVSTDGDGDRPLLIGGDGKQINGDVLCTLAARALSISTVVTPLTSTGAIELSGWFDTVVRTRIGSPHVVKAMQDAGGTALAGFEANGGFLLGTPLDLPGGRLGALPTRDAILPLVAVLIAARQRVMPLAGLVAELPGRVMKADRLKQIAPALSAAFLDEIATSPALRARFATDLEHPAAIDLTDGVRFALADGGVVHFRASGNAPELRVYVETESAGAAEQRLALLIDRLENVLAAWPKRSESEV